MNDLTGIDWAFLAQEEGVKLKAYKDSKGIWTIAVGNTYYEDGSKVKAGDEIIAERAHKLFSLIGVDFAKYVLKLVTVKLNGDQKTALISLAYNIGKCGFKNSTVLKVVNSGNFAKLEDAFLMWNKAKRKDGSFIYDSKGRHLLTARRLREAELFLT